MSEHIIKTLKMFNFKIGNQQQQGKFRKNNWVKQKSIV